MEFLIKLILPIILVFLFRKGRPFKGTDYTRFLGDVIWVIVGWIVLFKLFG